MHYREVSPECATHNRADDSHEHRTTRTRDTPSSSSGNSPDDCAGACPNERSDGYTCLLGEFQPHFTDTSTVVSSVVGNNADGPDQMGRAYHLFLCGSYEETNHPQ